MGRRFDVLDGWRTLAIALMTVYHFLYDLALFGVISWQQLFSPALNVMQKVTCGSFILLAGASARMPTLRRRRPQHSRCHPRHRGRRQPLRRSGIQTRTPTAGRTSRPCQPPAAGKDSEPPGRSRDSAYPQLQGRPHRTDGTPPEPPPSADTRCHDTPSGTTRRHRRHCKGHIWRPGRHCFRERDSPPHVPQQFASRGPREAACDSQLIAGHRRRA